MLGHKDARLRRLTAPGITRLFAAGPRNVADIRRSWRILTLPPDFHRIDPRTARIVLIEAGPRLLNALPEALSRYAQRALESTGVEVWTSTQVVDLDAHSVCTAQGKRNKAATVIWLLA